MAALECVRSDVDARLIPMSLEAGGDGGAGSNIGAGVRGRPGTAAMPAFPSGSATSTARAA